MSSADNHVGTPHICVSVAEATLEELLQDGSLPSRPEESPPLLTVEEVWKTASQVEPRLHLTPPCKTQPDFAKSDMVVAKANRQVKKKIYIFLPKKSHLSAVLARGTCQLLSYSQESVL